MFADAHDKSTNDSGTKSPPSAPGKLNLTPENKDLFVGREETYRCFIRFNPAEKPSAAGPSTEVPIPVAKHMMVELHGDPTQFEIEPKGRQEIVVPDATEPVSYFSTKWQVKPLIVGHNKLVLSTYIVEPGSPPNLIDETSYEKVVTVKYPETIQYWASLYWKWPTFGGGTLTVSTLAGIFLRRRKIKDGGKGDTKPKIKGRGRKVISDKAVVETDDATVDDEEPARPN